jgi:antirestriction protein ArdC
MIHSTGIEKRLNRNTGKRFGDKLYAREELVAELGAARIGQVLGFDKHILDNNAAYLDGWICSLKEEPKFVLSLMGDVDKASRMILDKIAS